MKKIKVPCHVRHMIRRDLPELVAAEPYNDPEPAWAEEDFLRLLRDKNCAGSVAETYVGQEDSRLYHITGHMIYVWDANSIQLVKLAVAARWRDKGVAGALLGRLCEKLRGERAYVEAVVREGNLTALKMLRHLGWRATELIRCWYGDEDGIAMRYQRH